MRHTIIILLLGLFIFSGSHAQSKKEKREEDAKRGYMLLDTHELPKNKKLTSPKYQSKKKKSQKKIQREAKKVRKKQKKQPY